MCQLFFPPSLLPWTVQLTPATPKKRWTSHSLLPMFLPGRHFSFFLLFRLTIVEVKRRAEQCSAPFPLSFNRRLCLRNRIMFAVLWRPTAGLFSPHHNPITCDSRGRCDISSKDALLVLLFQCLLWVIGPSRAHRQNLYFRPC